MVEMNKCRFTGCRKKAGEFKGISDVWMCDEHYRLYRFIMDSIDAHNEAVRQNLQAATGTTSG